MQNSYNFKKIFFSVFSVLLTAYTFGQNNQTFYKDNFSVSCTCKLKVNELLIKTAKQQGNPYPISSYIGDENEANPNLFTIYNINITDLSQDYSKISKDKYAYFESEYLKTYKNALIKGGYIYKEVNFKGLNAIEYDLDLEGIPAKAIVFIKNKKSYLLQVTTKSGNTKFNNLKSSFKFL